MDTYKFKHPLLRWGCHKGKRIFYNNIKTLHGIVNIMQVIRKILQGIMI